MLSDIVPKFGDSFEDFLPWIFVCFALLITAFGMGYVLLAIERFHEGIITGSSPHGREIQAKLANAEWNKRVREYCKTHGMQGYLPTNAELSV